MWIILLGLTCWSNKGIWLPYLSCSLSSGYLNTCHKWYRTLTFFVFFAYLCSSGLSALRYLQGWLWLIPCHLGHGRQVNTWWLWNHAQCYRMLWISSLLCLCMCIAHSLWPRELPRQAHGVHLSLSEHHGMWHGQCPLSEDGVWRVSHTLTDTYI